jgi:hypothetical protein
MYVCVSAKTERAPHLSPSEESEIQAKPTTRPALSYTHTHSPRPAAAGGTKRTKRGAAGHAAKGPRSTPARKGRQETVHGRDREKASTSTSPNENDPWPGLAWPYNNNKKDLNFGRCNISTSRGLSRLEQYIWSTIASLPVLFKQKKRVFFCLLSLRFVWCNTYDPQSMHLYCWVYPLVHSGNYKHGCSGVRTRDRGVDWT